MDSERRIAPMVMQLHAALVSELHERLSDAGYQNVRSPHCQVLGLIAPGGSRLTDLAAATVMTRQSMGALVDYLEQLGYVERVGDPDDARAKLIRKTRRGDAAAVAVGQVGKEMEQAWADQIGPRRLEQLRAALSAILGSAP